MNKPLHQFFTQDHHRLEKLLDKATAKPGKIAMDITINSGPAYCVI